MDPASFVNNLPPQAATMLAFAKRQGSKLSRELYANAFQLGARFVETAANRSISETATNAVSRLFETAGNTFISETAWSLPSNVMASGASALTHPVMQGYGSHICAGTIVTAVAAIAFAKSRKRTYNAEVRTDVRPRMAADEDGARAYNVVADGAEAMDDATIDATPINAEATYKADDAVATEVKAKATYKADDAVATEVKANDDVAADVALDDPTDELNKTNEVAKLSGVVVDQDSQGEVAASASIIFAMKEAAAVNQTPVQHKHSISLTPYSLSSCEGEQSRFHSNEGAKSESGVTASHESANAQEPMQLDASATRQLDFDTEEDKEERTNQDTAQDKPAKQPEEDNIKTHKQREDIEIRIAPAVSAVSDSSQMEQGLNHPPRSAMHSNSTRAPVKARKTGPKSKRSSISPSSAQPRDASAIDTDEEELSSDEELEFYPSSVDLTGDK